MVYKELKKKFNAAFVRNYPLVHKRFSATPPHPTHPPPAPPPNQKNS